MVLVWPSSLPQTFMRQNHSQQIGDGRLRSQTDVGPGKLRRRFSSAIRPIAGDMVFSTTQKLRVELFWDADTDGGVLPFLFPATGLHNFPLLGDDGLPLLDYDGSPILHSHWWLVRFSDAVDPPRFAPLGVEWQAPIALQVLP